jgi:hypothetical protein
MRASTKKFILILLALVALNEVHTRVYYGFDSGAKTSITGSDIVLEEGTSGTSTVYMNATSATALVDSHSTIFYPNDYNVTHGVYVSGATPDDVMGVDSAYFVVDSAGSDTTVVEYYPSSYSTLGRTSLIGGSLANLTNDDSVYLSFKSYRSNLNYTDVVNNDSSNVDSKDDVGTHSDFTAQQSGPDSVYDTLSEVQVPEDTVLYFVDNNSSDVDGSPAVGSNSNFENEKAVDSNYNVLTEQQFYVYEALNCNSFDNAWSAWYENGTSPYLNAQDQPTNLIYEKSNGQQEGWFGFADTNLVGSLNLNISIYCHNVDGVNNDHADVYVDYTGSGAGSLVGEAGAHTNWQYDTINLGAHTVSEVNNLRVYFKIHKSGASNNVYIDHVQIGVRGVNHRLDLENQFTSVDAVTNYDVAEICIKTGTTGSEDLSLSIWNTSSSSWNLLAADLVDSGWTNVTVMDYVASTMTIRFRGGTETLDISQNTWQIDAVLLKQCNLTYQVDLEAQWTGLNYTRVNEYLGIYGGTMGAEDIHVDVWYNGTWNNLFTDLEAGWNNASISQYLDSSTLTVRFRDATTAKDRVQDTWQVDASVIRTWSDEFTAEVELEGSSNLYEWAQLDFTLDSNWSNDSISVTAQLYDFSLASYPSSGQGYISYTSGVGGIDETKTLSVTSSPEDYRNGTGWWRVKIKGVLNINDRFQANMDLSRITTPYYTEYTAQTEFIFTDVTDNQSPNLNFTVVTHNSVDGATLTIQVWNYTSSSYATSGQGYVSYTSTGTNIVHWLNLTSNAQTCLSVPETRIRVTSVYATTDSFQQITNLVRLQQEESLQLHDYALRVTNNGASAYDVRLSRVSSSNVARLINCTIYFRSGEQQIQVIDGAFTQSVGTWATIPAASSLDLLIEASSIGQESVSVIDTELTAMEQGTSTYTKLPVQITIH